MSRNTEDPQNDLIPFLHTSRRALPSLVLQSEFRRKRPRSTQGCLLFLSNCTSRKLRYQAIFRRLLHLSPWELRVKAHAAPWATKKSPFSGNEGDSDSRSPLESLVTLFLGENSHVPQDLGWTHSPVVLESHHVLPHNKEPWWWQMQSWAVTSPQTPQSVFIQSCVFKLVTWPGLSMQSSEMANTHD